MYDPDIYIINRIQDGDSKAFEELVNKYKDRAMTLAFNILRKQQDAEDCLQDAFIKTFKSIVRKQFGKRSKFSTYFYRIVYNTALDYYKRLKQRRLEDDEGIDFEPVHFSDGTEKKASDSELQNLVNTYLEQIPEIYSVILTMFYINDLSHEDISGLLKLPIGTVKNRIFRAKEKLKEVILSKYSLETIQEMYS